MNIHISSDVRSSDACRSKRLHTRWSRLLLSTPNTLGHVYTSDGTSQVDGVASWFSQQPHLPGPGECSARDENGAREARLSGVFSEGDNLTMRPRQLPR